MLVPKLTKHRYVPVGQHLQSAVESHTGRAREEVAPQERGIRKGEAVHVLHGAVHLLSEASLCRSLARAPDHVIHGIDGVDDETALSQYHGCEPRSAADIEHALAGRERQFLNPSERDRQTLLIDRRYEARRTVDLGPGTHPHGEVTVDLALRFLRRNRSP